MIDNDLLAMAIKIGLSALLAGAIGAEREWTGKWAGLRTHMLISVGSAFLTDVSIKIGPMFAEESNAWDPGRIAAQIVSGIGFLGAGTIIQARGAVHGLTTAAGLWVAAAIGIAVGAGLYAESTLVAVALLLILTVLRPVERRLFRGEIHTMVLLLKEETKTSDVMELAEQEKLQVDDFSIASSPEGRTVRVRYRGKQEEAERFLQRARGEGLVASEAATERPPFP